MGRTVGGKKKVGGKKGLKGKTIRSRGNVSTRPGVGEGGPEGQDQGVDVSHAPMTLTQIAKSNFELPKKRRKTKFGVSYGREYTVAVDQTQIPILSQAQINYSKSLVKLAKQWEDNTNGQQLFHRLGEKEFHRRANQSKVERLQLAKTERVAKYWVTTKDSYDRLEEQERLREIYQQKHLIPMYEPIKAPAGVRASSNLIDPALFQPQNLEKFDIVVEKPSEIPKDKKKNLKVLSLGGQNLQASIDDNLRFKGFYFQDGSQTDPLPHFGDYDTIQLQNDSDPAGHYSSYILNYYVKGDPKLKNVDFGRGKLEMANEFKAMRFLAQQIVTSSAFRRNKAIDDVIVFNMDSSLKYRNSSGQDVNLAVTDEKLAITNYLFEDETKLHVKTPDQTLIFDFKAKDLPENVKPRLEFEWNNKSFQPLDSDTLLQTLVDREGMEPGSVQAILESLHASGWINYPRADVEKALDDPIFVTKPFEMFKGTKQEKDILMLILNAEGENYIKDGFWRLYYGNDVIAKVEGRVFGKNSFIYSDDQLDIDVKKQGKTPQELTEFVIKNNINTPATRTLQLAELKQSGVVSLVNGVYQLDKRGITMKAAHTWNGKNSFDGIKLKQKIRKAKSVDELTKIISGIQPIDRGIAIDEISIIAQDLIEAQDDLSDLEA